MTSKDLKKIRKSLKNYFTYQKSSCILVVSLDKSELPFCYIVEENDVLMLSYAINFPVSAIAANVALEVNKTKKVVLAENFYISNSGSTVWGEDAERLFNIDNFIDLENIEAASETLN